MHIIVAAAQADADAVLDILNVVVVDLSVERLEDGNPGVLHAVDLVVCSIQKKPQVGRVKRGLMLILVKTSCMPYVRLLFTRLFSFQG